MQSFFEMGEYPLAMRQYGKTCLTTAYPIGQFHQAKERLQNFIAGDVFNEEPFQFSLSF